MLGKVTGNKVDCLVCPVHLAMILLKDNLPMMNKNCFCFCYVTTQIIFDFSVNKYQTNKYLSTTIFWVVVSYTAVCCYQSLSKAILNKEISQGSVARRLKCCGMFNNNFITNLLMNLPEQELWKSDSIWQSYGKKV